MVPDPHAILLKDSPRLRLTKAMNKISLLCLGSSTRLPNQSILVILLSAAMLAPMTTTAQPIERNWTGAVSPYSKALGSHLGHI